MKKHIPPAAWIILALHFALTTALLFFGYNIQTPAVRSQEFPFTITYTYQGQQNTISGVYAAEYTPSAKYLGDNPIHWFGHIRDQNLLESDFIRIGEDGTHAMSIDLNLEPGWLMGDSAYAGSICAPTAIAIRMADGHRITDTTELDTLGFRLDGWEYPQPIENRFSFGGISLSSEAVLYTSAIAIAALLLNLVFIRKDEEHMRTALDKFGAVANALIAAFVFPFVLIVATLSEILHDTSAIQQLLYLAPALTLTGVGASVVLRRRGYSLPGFLIQFIGPAMFLPAVLIGQY